MKKFLENEVFTSTLKVYPKVKIFVNDGSVYYNNTSKPGIELNDFLQPIDIEDAYLLTEAGDILFTETGFALIIEEAY